jgi:kynureninase
LPSRFAMPEDFRPAPGAEGWQVSNQPILAAAPVLASLRVFDRAGIAALRQKSKQLTQFLQSLLETQLHDALTIVTPRDPEARGCQLSLRLHRSREAAHAVFETLCTRGFVGDWREPDVIRVAPVPLYNTYVDALNFVEALKEVCRDG